MMCRQGGRLETVLTVALSRIIIIQASSAADEGTMSVSILFQGRYLSLRSGNANLEGSAAELQVASYT